MKESLQRIVKQCDRKEIDQLYEYIKSGELLEFVQGEIIFRNDVSLKEQEINIGDCFYRKSTESGYYIARVDMVKEDSCGVDVTQIFIDNEDLDVWETEIRKLELLRVWKPFDKSKTQELISLWENADKETTLVWNKAYDNALKIVTNENNQHS